MEKGGQRVSVAPFLLVCWWQRAWETFSDEWQLCSGIPGFANLWQLCSAFRGKILNFVELIPESSGQMKKYENCL